MTFQETRAKFEGGQQPALEGASPPSNNHEAGAACNLYSMERSRLLTRPGLSKDVRKIPISPETRECTQQGGVDQPGGPGQGARLDQPEGTSCYSWAVGDCLSQTSR